MPAPAVDTIFHVLMRLRLVAGMEVHQRHRFPPRELDTVFSAPLWRRRNHRTFQLRLHHLFVFEPTASVA